MLRNESRLPPSEPRGKTKKPEYPTSNTAPSDAAWLTFTITVQEPEPHAELRASLDSRITEFTEERGIGAAAVDIMKDGEIIYDQVFGWQDQQRTVPLPENVIMRLASVTKPITAAAVDALISAHRRGRGQPHHGGSEGVTP